MDFDTADYKTKSLFSALSDEYQFDYMLYSLAGSVSEYMRLLDTDYLIVMKYLMLKKFDTWIENERTKGER